MHVRSAAQRALESLAIPAFQSAHVVTYHNFSQYDSFEQFATHFSSRSFNKLYTEAEVRLPEVKEAFERLRGSGHRFTSPKQVTFLQGLKTWLLLWIGRD